jgi:hypothetical protein
MGIAVGLLTVIAITAIMEPTHTARAILRGESFYNCRPTSHWREILRAGGQAHAMSADDLWLFSRRAAIPVLLECLRDPDRNVRTPAAKFLADFSERPVSCTGDVLLVLREELNDDNPSARLQALLAFMAMGPSARTAVPDLVKLMDDPVDEVRHYAELALWEVDSARALETGGWRRFSSPQWWFSAVFPASVPEEKDSSAERWGNTIAIHSFTAWHGITPCMVIVSEYPRETVDSLPENARIDAARDWIAKAADGVVTRDATIQQHGLGGREFIVETKDGCVMQSRHFWVGHRLYQVTVTFKPMFLNRRAADYFLDSFQLEPTKRR